jgi:environmental stress-induced protein Ves
VSQVLWAADRLATPWKNGGGVTREIAAWPPGAGLDRFDWRVSQADVTMAGPFSRFEGVDRTLLILDGPGLVLRVGAQDVSVLTPSSPPLTFPGGAEAFADLVDGPVRDLNVMIRRGVWRARVERHELRERRAILVDADVSIIVAGGGVCADLLSTVVQLAAEDAIQAQTGERIELWPIDGDACITQIALWRQG